MPRLRCKAADTSQGPYIIKDDQRPVDTSDGVVANAWLDRGHPGVNEIGRHDG